MRCRDGRIAAAGGLTQAAWSAYRSSEVLSPGPLGERARIHRSKQRALSPGSRGPRRWRCAQTNRSGRPRQRPPGHDRGYPRGRSEICGKPGGCTGSCGVDGDLLTAYWNFESRPLQRRVVRTPVRKRSGRLSCGDDDIAYKMAAPHLTRPAPSTPARSLMGTTTEHAHLIKGA